MSETRLKSKARTYIAANVPKVFFIAFLYVLLTTLILQFSFSLINFIGREEFLDRIETGELISFSMLFTTFSTVGLILALVLNILRPLANAGFISYCMKLHRCKETNYKDLFDGFAVLGKVFSIFIISSLLIIFWSLFFIFPGIVATYKYRQAYYILFDDPKKSARQCIRESSYLMKGNKIDLFILDFSFIGWHILNIIFIVATQLPFLFPLLSIWIYPYVGMTRVGFYEERVKNLAT